MPDEIRLIEETSRVSRPSTSSAAIADGLIDWMQHAERQGRGFRKWGLKLLTSRTPCFICSSAKERSHQKTAAPNIRTF